MNTDDLTTGKSAELKMDCPVCGGKGTATYTTQTHELAYFGEVVESTRSDHSPLQFHFRKLESKWNLVQSLKDTFQMLKGLS